MSDYELTLKNAEDAIALTVWCIEDLLAAKTVSEFAFGIQQLREASPQLASWHSQYNEHSGLIPREDDDQ